MRKAFLCLSILVLFAGFLAGQEQIGECCACLILPCQRSGEQSFIPIE